MAKKQGNTDEQGQPARKNHRGRPAATVEQMIAKGASRENAELCERLNSLINDTFGDRAAFVNYVNETAATTNDRRKIRYGTISNRLTARANLDRHDVKLIINCCCERNPGLVHAELSKTLLDHWDRAFGKQPEDVPQESSAVGDLARWGAATADTVVRVTQERDDLTKQVNELQNQLRRATDKQAAPGQPEAVEIPPPDSTDHAGATGPPSLLDQFRWAIMPNPDLVDQFKRAGMVDIARTGSPDLRRLYLLLTTSLGVSVAWMMWVTSAWAAAFACILLVLLIAWRLPIELHRFALDYKAGSPTHATRCPRRWRWPGRPQLSWWLVDGEEALIVLKLRPDPRWLLAVRKAEKDPYSYRRAKRFYGNEPRQYHFDRKRFRRIKYRWKYIAYKIEKWSQVLHVYRYKSRLVSRFTGRLKLLPFQSQTTVAWRIVNLDDGRLFAAGSLSGNRRLARGKQSVRFKEIKLHNLCSLYPREVGLHLIATGPARVAWHSPGISELSADSISEILGWWSDIGRHRVAEPLQRLRARRRATQLRRHRPDLNKEQIAAAVVKPDPSSYSTSNVIDPDNTPPGQFPQPIPTPAAVDAAALQQIGFNPHIGQFSAQARAANEPHPDTDDSS